MAWRYGPKGKRCAKCAEIAERTNEPNECDGCDGVMPYLEADLLPYWLVFTACETQLRVSMAGAYALDWRVVFRAAAAFGIPVDARFVRLLRAYERAMIAEITRT